MIAVASDYDPMLVIETLRDIEKDEEFILNYGRDYKIGDGGGGGTDSQSIFRTFKFDECFVPMKSYTEWIEEDLPEEPQEFFQYQRMFTSDSSLVNGSVQMITGEGHLIYPRPSLTSLRRQAADALMVAIADIQEEAKKEHKDKNVETVTNTRPILLPMLKQICLRYVSRDDFADETGWMWIYIMEITRTGWKYYNEKIRMTKEILESSKKIKDSENFCNVIENCNSFYCECQARWDRAYGFFEDGLISALKKGIGNSLAEVIDLKGLGPYRVLSNRARVTRDYTESIFETLKRDVVLPDRRSLGDDLVESLNDVK